MSKVYRRCSCRDAEGKQYGTRCPKLKSYRHGTWGYRISAGIDPKTQRRRWLSESGLPSADEAEKRKAEAEKGLRNGTTRFEKVTFADFATKWFEAAVRNGDIKPTTAQMYGRYLEHDILPTLGRLALTDVRKNDVSGLIDELRQAGRGAVTIRRIHATLRSVLTDALQRDLIDYNPASMVKLPTVSKARIDPWEPDQAGAFLDVASTHRLGVLFEIAVMTGLRRGELVGLRWRDVDLERSRLTVSVQLVRVGSESVESTIKTEAGQHRVVPLDERAKGALLAWGLQQAAEREVVLSAGLDWPTTDRVFTMENGAQLRPEYPSRLFEQIQATTDLPRKKFHDLRHLFASLALASGEDMGVVSKLMGHSNSQITRDLYAHLVGERARTAMRGVASLIPARKLTPGSGVLTNVLRGNEKAPLTTSSEELAGLTSQ